MAEAAAVEPVVHQRVAGAGRHRAQRDAVDGDRGDRRLERLGLEPFLGEFDAPTSTCARITRNMSLPPRRRSVQRELGQRQALRARPTCGRRGIGVR